MAWLAHASLVRMLGWLRTGWSRLASLTLGHWVAFSCRDEGDCHEALIIWRLAQACSPDGGGLPEKEKCERP